MPWGIFIEPANRLIGYESAVFYHPLFAYESVLSFGNMILLLWIARRFSDRLNHGGLFVIYLGVYSLIRFTLEFLRLDVALALGINVNQLFFIILFLLAGGWFLWRNRFAREL
jgi:phosphatidylglycerol:prolipoprotein diacylglycerol transferase